MSAICQRYFSDLSAVFQRNFSEGSMGKVWLVVAEFDDCDVPLELFESELGARNVAEIYAANFDRMWFNNPAVHDCSDVNFCGVRVVEFVNGIRQSETKSFAAGIRA
jgi:hypothetical protein